MTTLTLDDARQMTGATMVDSTGSKIGKVSDVYIDNDTQTPEWALVHTGMFGGRESFVPLAEARVDDGNLAVPYSKDEVKGAPSAEPDGELSQDEEAQLYAHYGLQYSEAPSDSGLPSGGLPAAEPPTAAPPGPPSPAQADAQTPAVPDATATQANCHRERDADGAAAA